MQAFTAEKTELLATYGADANRGLTEAQAQKNKEQYGARTPSPDASRTHC